MLIIHGVSKKVRWIPSNNKQNKRHIQIFLLPFRIVAIRYNTRLTKFVQIPETISKGPLWNQSQKGFHTIFEGIHVRKTCTFDGRLQAGKQEEGHRSQIREKEGDKAQLLSSEPGIRAHGSHCVQGHYRGAAFIFQSCATLVEPAGYAVEIGSKLPGKMQHWWYVLQ